MIDLKFDDLQAFMDVYKSGTFTQAARDHGLTQSALSQKISRIENTLHATVFVRHPRSLSLTASGEKLHSYAMEVLQRQNDFLSNFDQYNNELSGVIRIAGYSSIMRSLVIPKLAPFIRKNPKTSIEFSSHEMFELEGNLKTSKADFIITDYLPDLSGITSIQIDIEEYVIIEARKYAKENSKTFLDHSPRDNATESYFKFIGKKIDYKRAYLGDVYSIIDGTAQGLGRSVMSKHLIENDKRFNILREKKKYTRPIVLSFLKQGYYSPLNTKVQDLLQ